VSQTPAMDRLTELYEYMDDDWHNRLLSSLDRAMASRQEAATSDRRSVAPLESGEKAPADAPPGG
jgi:hypothetical protein